MNNFNRDSRDRGKGRDFNRRGSFGGDRDRERPQMHEAICSDCGKRCEVPFKPTNQKPVYCSECFKNYGGRSGGFEKSSRGGDRFQNRREDSFGSRNTDISKSNNQYKEGLDRLIAKLDIIINILTAKGGAREAAKEVKKSVPEKIKKKVFKKNPFSKK